MNGIKGSSKKRTIHDTNCKRSFWDFILLIFLVEELQKHRKEIPDQLSPFLVSCIIGFHSTFVIDSILARVLKKQLRDLQASVLLHNASNLQDHQCFKICVFRLDFDYFNLNGFTLLGSRWRNWKPPLHQRS
mgnify:CR=1 FL=1